jgi:cytosine deaminase
LAAEGRVVLPAFVDAHVHLDKAFTFAVASANGPLQPNLGSAIAAVAGLRGRMTHDALLVAAQRAVTTLVANGVTAARAHVEIDVAVGLELVELHRAIADTFVDRLALQLVAFPQRGLEMTGSVELFRQAMDEGIDVVGGCPYVDKDPARHLDLVFQLAERHRAPVDLHLDFSDDPGRSMLGLVVERTLAHGMQGRVTIGHVTTLAAMSPDAQGASLDLLAEAGVALVVLPATDLFLVGHGEPGTRGLAPLERARRAGVRVAIANNNLYNPFAPYGNGNLVQAAWLTGIMRRLVDPEARRMLLEAITTEPARVLALPEHGPEPGAHAHFAVFDASEPDEVVLQAPAILATVRSGRLVNRLSGPFLHSSEP